MENRKQRPIRIIEFIYDEDKLKESGLLYLSGQGKILLDLFMVVGGPWDSRHLTRAVECHVKFKGITSPRLVVNYWVWKFKKAGLLKFYSSLEEYKNAKAV